MKNETTDRMMEFIRKSPTCFHTVNNLRENLIKEGFEELSEKQKWNLKSGNKYFVIRNDSSIISFVLPESDYDRFLITAAHSDSPSFKVKDNPDMYNIGIYRLNIEKYGGMLMNPWFDRALSIAGRVVVLKKEGNSTSIKSVLINIDKDLLVIPSLAIHMNRDANDGHKIDVQNEMLPVISSSPDFKLKSIIAKECGVTEDEIKGYDLFLYNRDEPKYFGEADEFILSPRLDDLECAFTTSAAFIDASKENKGTKLLVNAIFDNEEVGSQSLQGAASTFLYDVLKRISISMNHDEDRFYRELAASFMISADNAHAVHPNYTSSADPVNRPELNKGPVIKYNASQKYTTDSLSGGLFKSICEENNIPYQIYTNNSNVPGGSTLGNISMSQVSVRSVDIGLAQWAMHSPTESAGSKDPELMLKAIKAFYKSDIYIE